MSMLELQTGLRPEPREPGAAAEEHAVPSAVERRFFEVVGG